MNTNAQKSINKIISKANDLSISISTLQQKNPARALINTKVIAICNSIIKNAETIDLSSDKADAQLQSIAALAQNITRLLSNIQLTQINYVHTIITKCRQLALDISSTAKNITPYI
jgi:hypothetical protein